jgi:hypothetical protein
MCTILSLAQGWWSVAGLTSDIFGFSLLAVDVGREYLRHKRVQQLEEAASSAEWLVQEDNKPPEPNNPEEVVDTTLKAARKEFRDLSRRLHELDVRMAELNVQHRGDPKPIGSLHEKAQAFRILAQQTGTKPFKRAPIFTGVFFVLLGFVLQVIGAVPCT